jgi:membrane protein YdbS with pleckstrin-like domain
MIYEVAKEGLLYLLQAPAHPPEPPPGAASSIRVFRASPKFLQYRLIVMGIVYLILFLMTAGVSGVVLMGNKRMPAILAGFFVVLPFLVLGLAALSYFLIRLEYDMRYYMLSDRCMRIREGVLVINEVTLTFANIQHMEISQGPIQQLLGIADLVVKTAGGGVVAMPEQAGQVSLGHHGRLAGIDNAEEIRDLISSNLKHYKGTGLGDPEEFRRKSGGLTPAALAMLREVRDELRAWRVAVHGQG